jgi:capsular exopolysaccharide synthesis family protein
MGPGDYHAYKDYYETQYKLIKSRTLLSKVADSLGLKAGNPHKGADPVKKLLKIVKVKPVKNSQLVEISAEDPVPEMAAKIVNTLADEYIRQNLERNINTANEAALWLSRRTEEQRQKLRDSELALQRYREEHNISILPQITGEDAIEDIKAEYARLQALLANYSQRYTDEHPEVIELKAQINSLRNKIQGLEDVDMGKETMEYRVLEREVQSNKRMYEILLTRLKEIDLSSSLNVNNISIIDRAEIPKKPAKPRVMLNIVLALIAGMVGGISLGFFVDYLDTTIKSPEDVKEILESRFLGAIPDIEQEDEIKRDKIMQIESKSPIAEAYRSLRTTVLNCIPHGQEIKAILITSAEPQAGKTMTATNLAIALAQKGSRVLLVDSDLRRPQLHKIFGLDRHQGLSEYLSQGLNIDSIIKDTEIVNLKVITSGKVPSNPAEIISSQKLDELIRELRTKFDFILFDSPPIISVTDAIILADKVDASIQVVRSGRALVPIVLRAKEQLAQTKARIIGVILNDLKIHHSNYYYYRYYRYYGEDSGRRNISKDSSPKSKGKFAQLIKTAILIKNRLKRKSKAYLHKDSSPRRELSLKPYG